MCVLENRLNADALGGRHADPVDLSEGVHQTVQTIAALAGPEDLVTAPGSTLTNVLIPDTKRGPFRPSFNIEGSRTYVVGGDSIR